MTNHYCDMQNADVIMTIGSNNVENHPVSSKWVQRALDNGATWIVVDPRYTRSAEMASSGRTSPSSLSFGQWSVWRAMLTG